MRYLAVVFVFALAACAGRSGALPYAGAPVPVDLRDLGARAAASPVDVTVILRLNRETELERLVEEISDPGSPQYHEFLTARAFDERFAPRANQIRLVTSSLERAGFQVEQTYPHGTLLRVRAATAVAEQFFHTRIHDFDQAGYGVRYSNVRSARVPRSLRRLVLGVELNDVVYSHAGPALVPSQRALETAAPETQSTSIPTSVPRGPGKPIGGPTYGPDTWTSYGKKERGWGPVALADAFDFPVQHGYNGSGVTVGVVIDATIKSSDLDNYKAEYRVKQTGTITTVPVAKATPYGNDFGEVSLDVETISGLAPGANVAIYDIPELKNSDIEEGYEQLLADAGTKGKPHVSVVNSSFGACEMYDTAFDNAAEQDAIHGAALGITFVASSGDWGATCYHGKAHPFGVNVPAAAPHFLSVGGNQSYSSEGIANPVAWWNCDAGFNPHFCATGGGVSTHFKPLPSYQAGISGIASTKSRNVPDIAFPAVLDDIYYSGGSYPPGYHGLIVGTSWSSPTAVALLAEAEQICGSAFGWVNPAIYSIYKTYGESPYFIDVTSGTNAGFLGKPGGYKARPGYDNATGIGMPNGIKFAAALCPGK